MELSRARANQVSTHSSGLWKQEEIKVLLMKLAVRRQAKIAEPEYAVFSEDLMEFDLRDIQAAIESFPAREEGETAFPDCDTVKRVVRTVGRNRRTAEERERRMADEAAERRHRERYPEEYEPIGPNDLKAMAERLPNFNFDMPREHVIPEPKMEVCPHCQKELPVAGNIRFWTAKEMYEFAALKEELERIAAKNREDCLAKSNEFLEEAVSQ